MNRHMMCSRFAPVVLVGICIVTGGCKSNKKAPTTRPSTVRERQEQALKDPFGYKVMEDDDISGGKLHEYKKDSMKKDLNDVLNP